jgi:hypothetical protein
MTEEEIIVQNRPSNALLGALAVLAILSIATLVWCFGLNNHVKADEDRIAASEQKSAVLAQKNGPRRRSRSVQLPPMSPL